MKLHEIKESKIDSLETIAEQKKQNELKFLGSKGLIRGHIIFSLNTKTSVVSRAKLVSKTEINWQDAKEGIIRNEIVVEPNCVYVSALNQKNAEKKFLKLMTSSNK